MSQELKSSSMPSSHPAVQFKQVPVTPGVLFRLNELRSQVVRDVVQETQVDLSHSNLEILLGEALYSERIRMKRFRGNVFTRKRQKGDRLLWSSIQRGLLKPAAEVDRRALLDQIVTHYAEEIAGHFDSRMYAVATRLVPWGFNWLLNAAHVQRFLPWGMTESLASRILVEGEVPALQRLAQKGTILLVPTHQSNIDSPLIGYVIYLMSLPPFAYGAGLNLFSNPALSFFMNRLGTYTVDRQKFNQIYKDTLKNYSIRILKEGVHSIFFPGGGRSRSGAIESKVKLGLLGTGLDAQLAQMQAGRLDARVFVVPMTMSYHFVLEASSLIENYLAESGKHRFFVMPDESLILSKVVNFFWKFFASQTDITIRVGRPMDVFGNFVDEEGRSLGPNGTTIDPCRWLSTKGVLAANPQRDREYTRELGARLVDRFHRENTVLTSHLAAFAFFESLRERYPEYDLFRFLRLSLEQRSLPYGDFLVLAERYHRQVMQRADRGELFVSAALKTSQTEAWLKDGMTQLGLLHGSSVMKVQEGAVWTEDMNLLYYYRNRLTGYGLSQVKEYDSKGFLA